MYPQTWTEKLRASGVFTPNQRNPEHFYVKKNYIFM